MDLAEEPQGVGFVASFLMGPGELKGVLPGAWVYASSRRPANRYASLSQATRSAWSSHVTHHHGLLNRLLQQQ